MPTIEIRRLACGMPLLTEVMTGVRSAAIVFLVPCGIAQDPDRLEGISALWSELLMRGAGEMDSRQHADALDRLGVSRSVNAGAYYMQVAGTMLGDRMAEALPLLTDMMLRPRFDEESLEPARELALQAIESLKDEPQERAMLGCQRRHLPTPLNRSGLGTVEGLTATTIEDVRGMWKERARPGRGMFAAAGAIEPAALEKQLNGLFSGWSGTTEEFVRGPMPARGYEHEADDSSQVQILLMHDAPSESSPKSLLEKIVVNVLSGGMSGRLFTEVREKRGLCYSVSAGYRGDRDFGVGTAYVGTTPERAQESLDVLRAELARINTPEGKITAEEFSRAVIGMKSRLVFAGESTSGRSGALASDYHRLKRCRTLQEMGEQIDRVTLDEVNAYLAQRSLGAVTIQTVGKAELK
jgi:predicted Zn-dependent peptidase